jgi:hypothetical protein
MFSSITLLTGVFSPSAGARLTDKTAFALTAPYAATGNPLAMIFFLTRLNEKITDKRLFQIPKCLKNVYFVILNGIIHF